VGDSYPVSNLRAALEKCRTHFIAVGIFSALLNLLFLVPMLYMLQVYDRVVPTRGGGTLLMLTMVLLLGLITLALLDWVRSRLLVRASIRLDREVAAVLLDTTLARPDGTIDAIARQAMRDFDALRQAITGPVLLALCDAPWAPIYVLVCFIIHPALGLLVLAGSLILATIAWANERGTSSRLRSANDAAAHAYASQEQVLANAENVRALGMRGEMVGPHIQERRTMLSLQTQASLTAGGLVAGSKFLRLTLQSLALGLGAFLAIRGSISIGSVFAASFLAGRALQPIDQVLAAWPTLVRARAAYQKVDDLLRRNPASMALTQLPPPAGRVEVEQVIVGRTIETRILVNVSFAVEPGEVVTIVGPSGAGKSTLLRVIAGALTADAGTVRIDGARTTDWDPDRLGKYIGYLPQDVSLFAGTIKENIARFDTSEGRNEIDELAIDAAGGAYAHDMILRLPGGYDAKVGEGGAVLSGGQRQRIALARALYGDPFLVVLDAADTNLDAEGDARLARAIATVRRRGGIVVVVANRRRALAAVENVLALADGRVAALGRKEEVLNAVLRQSPAPHARLQRTGTQ
jgi:PrtD family type I secretion system ABC transporter